MSNEQALRQLLEKWDSPHVEEANEFLDAIIEEHKDEIEVFESRISALQNEISTLEKENTRLENELEETPDFQTVNLGLDTLHYHLDKGNLLIQQRLEDAIRVLHTVAHAEPELF